MAEVMDGEFDFLGDTIRILSAPEVTLERLRSVVRVIRAAPPDQPPEQLLQAIEVESPELAQELRRRLPRDPTKVREWIMIVLMVLQTFVNMKELDQPVAPTPSETQIEQIIRDVIDSEQQSHSPRESPPAPPASPSSSPDAPKGTDRPPPAPRG